MIQASHQLPVIAVTMSTSRQGLSVVKNLSKTGLFDIRALTRNPYSELALYLASLPNVDVLKADLLDLESLQTAFSGAYGIFGNTTPTMGWRIFKGSMEQEYELAQSRNLLKAVKVESEKGSMKQFVFSSICKPLCDSKRIPPPSHFETKWIIEENIVELELKPITTILRPVSYLENFYLNLPFRNIFPGLVNPNSIWQTIAVDDVGLWTKASFLYPKKFLGEAFNIAGEEMTGTQMARLLTEIRLTQDNPVKYIQIPRSLIRLLEHDLGIMGKWIEEVGYGADLNALKRLAEEVKIFPTSLRSWLEQREQKNFAK